MHPKASKAVELLVLMSAVILLALQGHPADQVSPTQALTAAPNSPTARNSDSISRDHTTSPVMSNGTTVRGMVVDAYRSPISHSVVRYSYGQRSGVVTTSYNGEFEFVVASGYVITLGAEHEGRNSDPIDITLSAGHIPHVILVITSRPTLVLTVLDEDAKPITDATVTLNGEKDGKQTAPDGTVTLYRLPLDALLTVSAQGFALYQTHFVSGTDDGLTIRKTIKLNYGVEISGSVVDETKTPVPHTRVEIFSNTAGGRRFVLRSEDGSWSVCGLAPGRYVLRASGHGVRSLLDTVIQVGGVPLRHTELSVHRARVISGIVRTGAKPVSRAIVTLSEGLTTTLTDVSDEQGRFEFSGLRSIEYRVNARTDTQGSAEHLIGPHDDGIEIDLTDTSISGRVISTTILGGIRIDARFQHQRTTFTTFTDSSGAFLFTGLPVGHYKIHARDPFVPHSQGTMTSATTGDHNITVHLAQWTLRGRVLRDGRALPHYGLLITPKHSTVGWPRIVRTDDGSFAEVFSNSGTFTISVLGDGLAPAWVKEIIAHNGLSLDLGTIEIGGTQSLRGCVRDAYAAPVEQAEVVAYNGLEANIWDPILAAAHGTYRTRTNSDGCFELRGVPSSPGVALIAIDQVLGRSEPTVPTDDHGLLDIRIASAGVIRGTVRLLSQEMSAVVVARRVNRQAPPATAQISPQGEFEFMHLSPGVWELAVATDQDSWRCGLSVGLGANEEISVELCAEQ